ncbi:MAG: AraC family transcriptional regulator [Actinomycetota bacterium]
MYDPVKDGVDKSAEAIRYVEASAPERFAGLVHCFWEMKTVADLADEFTLHVLPDACVNLLFDQLDPRIAGVTRLHTTHITLRLGRRFHFAGIQLYPGVWRGDPDATVDRYVGEPFEGSLPLVEAGMAGASVDFDERTVVFARLADRLVADGLIEPDPVTAAILGRLDEIDDVADMARVAALSPRQLQRRLKATTGFTPHDLLKVLRVQRSFRHDTTLSFTDQAHYTHAFKHVTGLPPGRFRKTFDV